MKVAVDKIKRAAADERRSPLYLWMLRNHDTFAAAVAEAGRPNWKSLAKAFADEGLKDLKNRPPTAEGTRQTWLRVRKAVKNAAAKNPPKPGKSQPMPQPTEDKKPLPAPDYLTPEPELTPEQEFPVRFAKLRKHSPQKPPEDK